MDQRWRETREFGERLRWARRTQTEFSRGKDAAISLGIEEGTYRTYERRKENGGRVPDLPTIQRIARKFKVSWSWLATGNGRPDDDFLIKDERVQALGAKIAEVPEDKKDDAVNAALAVVESFIRRAG